ncbi:hypothetical protein E0687_02340 [Thermus tengchongensis]|uniref:Uncharacterized protein n=2 Tax=Thermus tengchongensis TaxID=1214928 RepID=A0A4Y9FDK3_9DEIN|nr:hypothetical protein E0687_02340 [Thermus tengchongensis]
MMSCLLLSTLLGSALFAGLGEVGVGRLWVEGGHRALVVTSHGAYALEAGEDSALYGLARTPEGFLTVGHLGKSLLRVGLDPKGKPLWAEAGGQGILWGTDGRFAWGGYMGPGGWEALVLDLVRERALRLPLTGQGYAYGGLYRQGVLFLVGRVEGAGGFDGFLLGLPVTGPGQPWAYGYRSGWPENDYLRFLGGRGAVGRLEVKGDSEGLLLDWLGLSQGKARLLRRPGFDYFRAWHGAFLVGEAEVDGILEGLWIGPQGARYAGGPMASLRALDPPFAYGYSYRSLFQGEGMVLDLGASKGKPLAYRLETLRLPWLPFRARPSAFSLTWKPMVWNPEPTLRLNACPPGPDPRPD